MEATSIWTWLKRLHAWGTVNDVKDDIAERFSDEEATTFYEAIVRVGNARRNAASVGGVDYDARPALLNVPAPFFLDALEYVVSQATGTYGAYGLPGYTQADAIHEINRQFAVRGVWFEMSANGRAEWHGDQHIFTEILAPALAALMTRDSARPDRNTTTPCADSAKGDGSARRTRSATAATRWNQP